MNPHINMSLRYYTGSHQISSPLCIVNLKQRKKERAREREYCRGIVKVHSERLVVLEEAELLMFTAVVDVPLRGRPLLGGDGPLGCGRPIISKPHRYPIRY